ncbi:hypothetical protein B1813_20280 [Saccharomonospora piscinae]|uniref:Uncharacterized protein n=1 Tax=Saccharomonospora piscinae TaxID=687388 RepID=A0A1V8ZWZ6_SACPI|nr:hypothetical protein [Saccharomonospora piscinae]OQO89293.1 hypothetical protein B1813_20280 [Saccharomonospora piscinae]TLW90981.1 hypothetical protein FFT09_17030 [Saccharomonospora piscinae]
MGWNEYYRRRRIMDNAVDLARRDDDHRIPFDHVDGAATMFGTEERLLLALHHRWTQLLTGHLRARLAGPENAGEIPGERSAEHGDHLDTVSRAWRAAVRAEPDLHAVLAANVQRHPALRRAHQAELRLLAVTSGLGEPHDGADDLARIGATLVALLDQRDRPRRVRPGRSVGRWLRRLAPSA